MTMAVYVDNQRAPFGRRLKLSHMIADTPAELHAMAARLGLRPAWFQSSSFPHYDVAIGKRTQAIELGAVAVDRRTLGMHIRRIRGEQPMTLEHWQPTDPQPINADHGGQHG